MKVCQINIFGNLSTGRIAVDIYRTLRENGHEGIVAFARNSIPNDVPHYKFGNKKSIYLDALQSRLRDNAGFNSICPTRQLLKKISEYDPDIIHLHNLHGYYLNVEMLFEYLKERGKPVVWTLHDCWSFTGHCCNFEFVGCNKWKEGCERCPQTHAYPSSIVDHSKRNYIRKKGIFANVDKLTIVTPSIWLKDLVKQSYMSKYHVEVIRNGVDLSVFKPTEGKWMEKNHIDEKKIILGVAGSWSPTKGLNDIIEISKKLPKEYKVVVVGVDKRQKRSIPESILAIERTNNPYELAEIYSSAQVFINPTYDDNFPNVNIEALACGTPVITYNTGGGPEIINDMNGAIVPKGDINLMVDRVIHTQKKADNCIMTAQEFERNKCYHQYIQLYKELLGTGRKR